MQEATTKRRIHYLSDRAVLPVPRYLTNADYWHKGQKSAVGWLLTHLLNFTPNMLENRQMVKAGELRLCGLFKFSLHELSDLEADCDEAAPEDRVNVLWDFVRKHKIPHERRE